MSEDRTWIKHCGLLFVGWVVMYANRSAIPALLGLMGAEWDIGRAQLGLISSAFFVAYTAFQVPSGYLSDRWGPRPVILGGQAWQGLAGLGAALSGPFLLFTAWRTLVGVGQGAYYAPQYAMATELVPRERRATALAWVNSGMAAGTLFGLAVAGVMAYLWQWPWRLVLMFLSGLGLGVFGLMSRLLPPVSKASVAPGPQAGVLTHRALRSALGAAFTTMYGLYTILSWTPYYLQNVMGLTGQAANVWASVVPAVAIPAGILAGVWADKPRGRHVMLYLVPLGGVALVLVSIPSILAVGVGLVLYGMAGKMVLDPLFVATLTDAVPKAVRGRAFAFLNLASSMAAVLAPTVTGYLADLTGSFAPGFFLAALAHVPAWFLVKRLHTEVTAGVGDVGVCPATGGDCG